LAIYTSAQPYILGNVTVGTPIPTSGYSVIGTPNYTTSASWNGTSSAVNISQSAKVELKGEDADIIINGMSLTATLKAIESRLAILKPAVELEAEWDELKRLGDEYRKLEEEIRAKMKTWDTLKKDY